MAGWVKQWEIPEDHWLRSSLMYMGAWNDLIQMAERKDRKVVKYGKMLDVKRGTIYTSLSELADRWKVSRWWVRHFLDMLEQDGMINRQQTDTRLTTIIVRNYAKYQDKPNNRPTGDRQVIEQDIVQETDRSFTSRPTGEASSFLISAEGKEGIEGTEGENIGRVRAQRFTPPTRSELYKYILDQGLNLDIDRFLDYYNSNGWMVGRNKMKDWKAAARNWANKDKKDRTEPKPNKFNNFDQRQSGDLMDEYIKQLEARYG